MAQADYDHLFAARRVKNKRTRPKEIQGLVNARLLAFEYPETFELPPDSAIRKLKVGDYVKVARNNERFWIKITGFVGRKWHGTIANELILNPDLQFGDAIYFEKKNIYDVLYQSPQKMTKYRQQVLKDAQIHPWGHTPRRAR